MTVYVSSPSGLSAYVEDNDNDVILNWQEEDGIWLQKCNDTSYNGIGTNNAAEFSVALKYTAEELSAYQGMYLSSIKIFPKVADATYTLKVWGGHAGMDELYSQNITSFENQQWNEYILDSTIAIPTSGQLYIGYRVNTPSGLPAGADNGPLVEGGNMIRFNDSSNWDYLHNLSSTLTVNFNIKAFASYSGQDRLVSNYQPQYQLTSNANSKKQSLLASYTRPIASSTDYSSNTRDLTGYKVYRDESLIASLDAQTMTYVDYDLPNGSYEYYVTQVYGAVDSNPSNRVNVTVHQLIANFSTENLQVITGQEVQFTNLSTQGDVTYYWDFGDGNFSNESNPLHTYTQAGSYSVSLTIYEGDDSVTEVKEDYITVLNSTYLYNNFARTTLTYEDDSNWDEIINNLLGNDYRVADWYDLVAYHNQGEDLLVLYDNLALEDHGNSAYVKRNGDPSYDSSRYYFASRHEHNKPSYYGAHDNIDNYLISLGSWYGSNYIFAYINLNPAFIASETICTQYDELIFTNQSIGNSNSYLWDFGDGTSSLEENPYHVYQEPGSYTVSLTISNDSGSVTETKEDYIRVNAINHNPNINLPESFTFEEDTTLEVDFSEYITDIDQDDQLILTCEESSNIYTEIDGFMVTFSAMPDWFGSEVLYFTVDDQAGDGIARINVGRSRAIASDSVEVIVTSVDDPMYVENPIDNVYKPMNSPDLEISLAERFYDVDSEITSYEITLNTFEEIITTSISDMTLTLSFTEDMHGSAEIEVTAFNNHSDQISLSFMVDIWPTPEMSVSPENFTISVLTGETFPSTFTVGNNGLGSLEWGLESITYQESGLAEWVDIATTSGNIESDDNQVVDITFSATDLSAGVYHVNILFNHNNPNQDLIEVPVTFTVLGLPEISVSTNSLDFGQVFVNSNQVLPLVISNTGSSTLTINNISSTGNYYSVNYNNFVIPVGQSRTIEVSFNPETIGNDDASLNIYSTDYLHNPLVLSLFAQAINPPEIEVIGQDLEFYVLGSGLDTETILIRNNGASTLEYNLESDDNWVSFNPFMGQLEAAGEQVVTVTVNPINLVAGIYDSSFSVNSNVPGSPVTNVNIQLVRQVYNVTDFDNDDNSGLGVSDNDLDVLVGYNSANSPIEFNIFSNNPNPETVKLSIRAWNVDNAGGGVHRVYLNDYILGELRGLSDTWTTTLFDVQPSYLDGSLINKVEIEVDSDFVGNSIKVDWGQLSYDNTSLNASIRYIDLDQTSYYAGASVGVTEEIDTNLANQEIRVETTIYSPWDTIVTGTSRVLTIIGSQSDAFTETLEIAEHYTPGLYELQVIVYDNNSNIQQALFTSNFEVKPYESEIFVETNTIDFGPVLENETSQEIITITNTGHADLVISEISSNHANFISNITSTTIGYNESQNIIISFTPSSLGQVVGNLTILSNASNTPASLIALNGIGIENVPYIEVSHTSLGFGDVYTIVPESQEVAISNVGPAPLEITNIISDNQYFIVDDNQAGAIINTNEELLVNVTFEPFAVQQYSGNITIISNADNQPNLEINVSGQGSIAPQVTYAPNDIAIAMSVGENISENLEISNTGGNELTWNIKDNFGKMFEVDGFNSPSVDYGYIRNRAPIQLYGGSFSVELWFKVDSNLGQGSNGSIYNGGKQCIVSKSVSSQTGSFGIYTDGIDNQESDKTLKVALNNGSNREFLVANNIELHQWYHVAVTYNDNIMTLYLDGNQIAQEEVANFSGNYDPWIMGKMSETGSNWYRFDGGIDEFRIWESARSHTEIANYRNVRLLGNEQNLGGYWNFDQEDLRDGSSYQTTGVIYGNAWISESNVSTIPSWISFSNTSGLLGPGNQTSLNINLDASDIIGGTYNQIIELTSNDPDESIIEIPLTINVTGIPNIVITPETLEFGNSFIGYSDTLSVLITNTGSDLLNLSNFNISEDVFTTEVTQLSIQANESQRIIINFTPEAETVYSGQFTFTTNLPGNAVRSLEITGNGVYTPQIALSTSSFSATVNSGQVTNQELTISNIQGEELNFDIELIEVLDRDVVSGVFDNLPNSNKGMVWVDGYLYIISYSQNKLYKYDISNESVIAQYPIHSSPFGITYDGTYLWIGSSSSTFNAYDLAGNQVDQFNSILTGNYAMTWNGENFIISPSSVNNPQIYTLDTDGSVISTIDTNFNGKMNQIVWVADHTGGELWGLDYSAHKIRQLNPTDGSVLKQISYNEFSGTSYALAHNGRDLWIAPDSETDSKLYRIEDNIHEFNWLTVSPASGSLVEGENQIVTLEYNARNLMAGRYEAVLDIHSNDAETPSSEIYVILDVNGQAVLVSSENELDFATCFIGQTLTEEIELANAGSSDLEINNIMFNSSDFSVTETQISIEPLASQSISISFTPLSSGVKTAQMTIYSNDIANSEYIIQLSGIAEGEPTLEVNPASLLANLTVDAEESQVLRLTNNGGSNLIYSLALDEANSREETFINDYELREIGFFADQSRNIVINDLPYQNLVTSEANRFLGDQIATYPNIPAWNAGLYWLDNELYIVDFNPDNEVQATGRLLKYDLETYQITESYPIHTLPYGITYDGTYFWIGNQSGNVYCYDPTTLNTSTNPPIASFSSPVDYFPALTYMGDSFLISRAFGDNPVSSIYRVAHNGDILETYSAYLGKNISQLVWVEDYYNNELWALQNTIEDEVIIGGKILQLQLVNSSIVVTEEKIFWDNDVIYSFTSNGKDLWISDVSGPLFQVDDGRWLSTDNTSGTIAPGHYQDINITFDPTGIYGGDYSGSVRLTSNVPQNSLINLPVTMRVQGYPEYEISDNQINFGEVAVGYSDIQSISLSNIGSDDLAIESITFTPLGIFTTNTNISSLAPGASSDINVEFSPDNNIEFDAIMDIQTNIGLVSVNLNGQGYLPPIIGLSIENIVSSLEYGQSEDRELIISNSGDRTLSYEIMINGGSRSDANSRSRSVEANDWLSLTPTSGDLNPGTSQTVTVNLSATDVYAGNYSALLLVNSNDPQGSQEIPVQLNVSGNPSISVSETDIDFASVLIGNSANQTFTVSNTGSSILQVSSVSLESNEFLVSPPSFTLAPEASRSVTVSFTPLSQGAKTASVTILSNDENGEEHVALTGYGVEATAEILASTDNLDFSQVNVGNYRELEYTLYNQGTGILRITNIGSSHPDFVSMSLPTLNSPINIQPGNNRVMLVRYTPTGDTEETAVLTITSNANNESSLEINMSGSGVNVPQITINKTSLDWFILDNTLYYDELVISNEGQAQLDYSLSTETLAFPWITANPASGSIEAGASATINLTLDTRNIDYGSYFANFTITSNDPDNSELSLPMILNHSNFNFTDTDNAGNDFVETPDNDLGINISENSPNAPVEFFIYTNESEVDYAKLRIRAYDIDSGEINYVFVNGTWVGQIVGSNNNYSITEFMINPELINLGENVANEIEISLDVNSTDSGYSRIIWGQFVFNQAPIYATISSLNLNKSNYYPGEEVQVNSIITTQLYNQAVRAEYELLNPDLQVIDTYQETLNLSVTSNQQASANLDLPPDSEIGTYSVKLAIYDNATNVKQSERTTNFNILSGDPVLSVNNEINFGSNYIGYPKMKNIQITNQGYAPLSISSLTTSNGFFSVVNRSFVLQNGESETITVTFESSEAGTFTENLIIESNDPNNQSQIITLSATAIEAPQIELSTTSIATTIPRFGTDSGHFTITNAGNSNLNISSIRVSGTSWLSVEPTSLNIPQGLSEEVELSFSAYDLTEGNYNAIVQVNSDDPDNPTLLIYVTMTVTERLITANFTATPLSGPKELEVTFTNLAQTSDGSQISEYQWDFHNDGIVDSYEIHPSYTYENRGSYSVRLTVENENGESHSLLRNNYISVINTIPVLNSPIPDIVMEEDSINQEIDLRTYFSDGDNDNLIFTVSGNHNIHVSITNDIVTLAPNQDWFGIEELTFTASDNHQGIVSDVITVTVVDVADAPYFIELPESITILQTTRQVIDFANHVYDPEQSLSLLSLSIDNNEHVTYNILGLEVAFYAPQDWAGTETLTVNVSDGSGRLVTSQDIDITITDSFNAEFTADNTEILSGQTVQFTDLTQGNPNHWVWYLDNDDVPDSYLQNPSINYNIGGEYSVSLVVSYIDEDDILVTSDSVRYENYISVEGTSIPGGNYFGDWQVALSPYNVYGQVSVESGTSLNIEPGTVINIMEDTDFIVSGGLIADGVTFGTVAGEERQVGEWEGIKFTSTDEISSLSNSYILNARKAIEINGASPNLTGLTIQGLDSEHSAVKISGPSQALIDDLDIDKYNTGIEILGDASLDIPVITNIRVRHTTNTSRTENDPIAVKIHNSNVNIDNLDIEDFAKAIEIKSTQGSSAPVLTNIRVRHTTNTSRLDDTYAIKVEGDASPNISNIEIEDFSKAMSFDALNSSPSPVLTNIRVRHTTNTSRELADTALEFTGSVNAVIDSLEIEDYLTGIIFDNSSRTEAITPTLTNIRVRHTTNTSRTNAFALKSLGKVNMSLNDFESDNIYNGILYDSSESINPTLTNIRVRHTTNTSRDFGGTAITCMGNVSPQMSDVILEDYVTGLNFDNSNRSESSLPVLTNIRVRHTTNTSRTDALALNSVGSVNLSLDDFESDNVNDGISIYSSSSSSPVLTNIRVRHTTNTSRELGGFGIHISGQVEALLDSLLIEDCLTGIYLENLSRTESLTPVLTNIRVRHTTNTSRTDAFALKSIGLLDLDLNDFESENVMSGIYLDSSDETIPTLTNIRVRHTSNTSRNLGVGITLNNQANSWIRNSEIAGFACGLKVTGNNNAIIERNTFLDNLVSFDLTGNECLPQIHHNHIENSLGDLATFLFASDIQNVQILNNNILSYSKIVNANNSSLYFGQNIIWGSPISEADLASGNDIETTFEYNNISMAIDNAPGIGNMNTDPLFTDSDLHNLELSIHSNCIDGGNPNLDLDPDGSIADIGMNYHHHLANFNTSSRFNTPGTPIYFDNKSEGHDDPTTDILWEFGDGHSSSLRNPEHIYQSPGIYNVTLTMTTGSFTDIVNRQGFVVTQDDPLPAPQYPLISMSNTDIILEWNEISESISGSPVANVSYLIYSCLDADGIYEYRDNVTELTWTDSNIAELAPRQFYFIIGFVDNQRMSLEDFINTHRYLTRDGNIIKPSLSKSKKN
jgi:PKD repeat protein/glutamine cyclotransferase